MECIRIKPTRVPVYLQFSESEALRFKAFLKATGRKAGPWFRTLALRAMDEADRAGDSCTEARELKAFIASLSPSQLRLLGAKPLAVLDVEAGQIEPDGAA